MALIEMGLDLAEHSSTPSVSMPHTTQTLTYSALRSHVSIAASHLVECAAAHSPLDDGAALLTAAPVALWIGRSCEFVIAALGAMSNNCCYLALDPDNNPPSVMARQVGESGARLVVAADEARADEAANNILASASGGSGGCGGGGGSCGRVNRKSALAECAVASGPRAAGGPPHRLRAPVSLSMGPNTSEKRTVTASKPAYIALYLPG